MDPSFVFTDAVALYASETGKKSLINGLENGPAVNLINDLQKTQEFSMRKYFEKTNFPIAIQLVNICDPECYDKIFTLITEAFDRVLDMILNKEEHSQFTNREKDNPVNKKELLEIHGLVMTLLFRQLFPCQERIAGINPKRKTSDTPKLDMTVMSESLVISLDLILKCMSLRLLAIFHTNAELAFFLSVLLQGLYEIISADNFMRILAIKMRVYKAISISVKNHDQVEAATSKFVQILQYFDNRSDHLAEIVGVLFKQYENSQLFENLMSELSLMTTNNANLLRAKSISSFLIKCSSEIPKAFIRNSSFIIRFLESESYVIRSSVIESCTNIICALSIDNSAGETSEKVIQKLLSLLLLRCRDINPYCRAKALQCFSKICGLPNKYPLIRMKLIEEILKTLLDKSSLVRKSSIKLCVKLVATHPFSLMHGGLLQKSIWYKRATEMEMKLNRFSQKFAEDGITGNGGSQLLTKQNKQIHELGEHKNKKNICIERTNEELTEEEILKISLTLKYYSDALEFIEKIHQASDLIFKLLSSKNKAETIEAMDYFVTSSIFRLECADKGVRKLMHLIWNKALSDEGRNIQSHLLSCFKTIYFEPPPELPETEKAIFIGRNLLNLIDQANVADTISLEQILGMIYEKAGIDKNTITYLWQIYESNNKHYASKQRVNAIRIIGMLASRNPEIILCRMQTIISVGLSIDDSNDCLLSLHSCATLRHLISNKETGNVMKLPCNHEIIQAIQSLIVGKPYSSTWFTMSEYALRVIFELSNNPDFVAANVLKRKVNSLHNAASPSEVRERLIQIVYIVGEIALQEAIYLENCEAALRAKHATKSLNNGSEDFSFLHGDTDDEIQDFMTNFKENEILFENDSLLAQFSTIIVEICNNSHLHSDKLLKIHSALSLSKLVYLSSKFCKRALPVLVELMEKAEDFVIRENLVIAIGDIAICHNHLIDENIDVLYDRLGDKNENVKRTCLLTLTFLILGGQIRVRGHLAEMAEALEDPDEKIADLARLFFAELSAKDNAVYNNFMDIFSGLSQRSDEISENSFQKIMKYLIGFVKKDRYAKQLTERLGSRLSKCQDEQEWRHISYTLSLLPNKSDQVNDLLQAGFKY